MFYGLKIGLGPYVAAHTCHWGSSGCQPAVPPAPTSSPLSAPPSADICAALRQRQRPAKAPFLGRPPMSWMLEVAKDSGGQFILEGFSFSSKVSICYCSFLLPHQLFFPLPASDQWRFQAQHHDRQWPCIGLSTSSRNTGS